MFSNFENLEYLFEFIDDLPVGIARADSTGELPNQYNRYFLEMFGWDLAEIDTMEKWFAHAYPDETYRETVMARWDRLIADAESQNRAYSDPIEVRIACKNGCFKWCELRYYRKKEFIYGIFSDITKQKENEEQLIREESYRIKNEKRLEMLLELNKKAPSLTEEELANAALDIAVEITGSRIGYLHTVNDDQNHITLVTWNKETLKHCTAAHDNHYPLEKAGIWADAARLKKVVVHNDYAAAPDKKGMPEGHFTVTRHMSAPVLDGETVKMIVGVGNKETTYSEFDQQMLQLTANDIEKFIMRKRAENEVKAQQELLQKQKEELEDLNRNLGEKVQHELDERFKSIKLFKGVIDSTTNTVALLGTDYRFQIVNHAFKELHKKTDRDVAGKTPPEAGVMPETFFNKKIRPALDRVMTGESLKFKTWLEKPDHPIYLSIQMNPYTPKNDVEGVIIITTDITKEYQLEQENLVNQKKAAMGELIGIIAHQLKQPLNAVSLTASLINDDYEFGELTAERIEKYENTLVENVEFMAKSIDDLRNFFRPDKHPAPYSIVHAIDKALAIVGTNISSKGIQIITDFRQDATISGIENELQQVILNIVTNAKDILVEKHPEEPFIKIATETRGNRAVICIEDNGGGVPDAHMEKIFDSYFTTKGEKGTGIGLNLSKMIVESSMNGKITIANSTAGAVFTIELPLLKKGGE